jgi:DNA-directed RNA polymerase subunit RPC12/RpoP
MPEYKDHKTGEIFKIQTDKGFKFPSTGTKILLKTRPPIAKEVKTD